MTPFITGSSASLRATGILRYVVAAFLIVWLAMWTVGGLALTMLLAFWAAWVTWSRREWLIRPGQLISHWRFAIWERERSFKSARLEVTQSTDSDSDDHYALKVIDDEGTRTIASDVNDDADIVDLGRWLSARTGFPLTLPLGLRPPLTMRVTEDELR